MSGEILYLNCFYFTFFDDDIVVVGGIYNFSLAHTSYTRKYTTNWWTSNDYEDVFDDDDDDDDNDGIKRQQQQLIREIFFLLCNIYFLFHTAITLWALGIKWTHTHSRKKNVLTHKLTRTSKDKHKEFSIAIQFRYDFVIIRWCAVLCTYNTH